MSYSDDGKQQEVGASGGLLVADQGDLLTLTAAHPIKILEIGVVLTTTIDDTAGDGMVLKADKRPTAGSDTGRGDGDLATMTLTNAQADGAAAGLVLRSRPASAGELDPGEQAVLELTNGLAVAGAGHPYVVYSERRAGDESDSIVVAS